MIQKNFVFAGNRAHVLEVMLAHNLYINRIFAVQDSYLERFLLSKDISYSKIPSKQDFIRELESLDFDYFVANGLPIILPISKLTSNNAKNFINVHPSFLPDLRGADPVPGALLYGRESGATCHFMDDSIDTGAIISKVRIENTPDLEAGLLYQLSFMAEKDVFERALNRSFEVDSTAINTNTDNNIYYTFKDADLEINFSKDAAQIIRTIKAFSTPSKGARFAYKGEKFIIWDAELVNNPFLKERIENDQDNQVILKYGSNLIIKKGDVGIKLKNIEGDLSLISQKDILN